MSHNSYFNESGFAPKEFHISSAESDGKYNKCLLCCNIKKHFFCTDCIRSGDFVHSSSHYSERFAEKQLKLYRLKSNRKHVKDRCEILLFNKSKKDKLQSDIRYCREKIQQVTLAIEQYRSTIDRHKQELSVLMHYNSELTVKLPRYKNRVFRLSQHAEDQHSSLQKAYTLFYEKSQKLAITRSMRMRQLLQLIFPVYISYDTRDSYDIPIYDDSDYDENDTLMTARLHIVSPWLPANGDYSLYIQWVSLKGESGGTAGLSMDGQANNVGYRTSAALTLAAQLLVVLAALLDVRLPFSINFTDYSILEGNAARLGVRTRRLCACVAALALATRVSPPSRPAAALTVLNSIATAVKISNPHLESWFEENWDESWASAWVAAWQEAGGAAPSEEEDSEPPEHLHWAEWDNVDDEIIVAEAVGVGGASLVTSAAASLASLWRGWTK